MQLRFGLAVATWLLSACGGGSSPNSDGIYSEVGNVGNPSTGLAEGAIGVPSAAGTAAGAVSGSPGTSATPTNQAAPTFELRVADLTGELYELKTAAVSIVAMNGFTGIATLSLEGLVPALTASLDRLSVGPNESATVSVLSKRGGATKLTLKAVSGSISVSREITFTAQNLLTLRLKKGADAVPTAPDVWGSPDSIFTVSNASPLTVKFKNLDTVGHIMHAGGLATFPHGDTNVAVAQDAFDKTARTLAAGQTQTFYLHDKGATTSKVGTIKVEN
jgi:hypothetical protein